MAGLFFMATPIAWIMHTWKKVTVSLLRKVTLFADYEGEGYIVRLVCFLFLGGGGEGGREGKEGKFRW